VKTLPICEASRSDVISSVNLFLSQRNTAQAGAYTRPLFGMT